MSDITNCYKCNKEGAMNRRDVSGKRELRTYGPNGEWMCYECCKLIVDGKDEKEKIRLLKVLENDSRTSIVVIPIDLNGLGCGSPDCQGCHPENFNEKGEFRKENLH